MFVLINVCQNVEWNCYSRTIVQNENTGWSGSILMFDVVYSTSQHITSLWLKCFFFLSKAHLKKIILLIGQCSILYAYCLFSPFHVLQNCMLLLSNIYPAIYSQIRYYYYLLYLSICLYVCSWYIQFQCTCICIFNSGFSFIWARVFGFSTSFPQCFFPFVFPFASFYQSLFETTIVGYICVCAKLTTTKLLWFWLKLLSLCLSLFSCLLWAGCVLFDYFSFFSFNKTIC